MMRSLAAGAALAVLPASGTAQVMSLSSGSIDLAPPDTIAYAAGASTAGAVSVMVTTCAGVLGCRVTVENPNAASPQPIDLEWRLVAVSQVGTGSLGCTAVTPLLAWQALSVAPVAVMETAVVSAAGTACTAALELRAVNLSYTAHQFTSPPSTYWRDVLLRTVEK